jgi:hypothetical protein
MFCHGPHWSGRAQNSFSIHAPLFFGDRLLLLRFRRFAKNSAVLRPSSSTTVLRTQSIKVCISSSKSNITDDDGRTHAASKDAACCGDSFLDTRRDTHDTAHQRAFRPSATCATVVG